MTRNPPNRAKAYITGNERAFGEYNSMGLLVSSKFIGAAAMLMAVTLGPAAAQKPFLSARESDPRVMGWMQGFPPPPDKLITQPDSNYFSFPKLRWSVCHLREFLPTEEISRAPRTATSTQPPFPPTRHWLNS